MLLISDKVLVNKAIRRMNEVTGDCRYSNIFDDGGEGEVPDGNVHLLPYDEIDPRVAKEVIKSGYAHKVVGDIIEYDGSRQQRAELDERYPGWCGFFSVGVAYCWTP